MQSRRECEPPTSVAMASPPAPRRMHAATAHTASFSRRPQRSGSESRRERSNMIIALLRTSGRCGALLALSQRGLGVALGCGRLEVERGRGDAVPLGGRPGTVVEDMAEVAPAVAADDLGALHEVTVVGAQLDRLGDGRLGEARPAGARVELRVGVEEPCAAGPAAVVAGFLVVGVLAREGRLGARPAQHLVLRGRQLLAPLAIGLDDAWLAHARGSSSKGAAARPWEWYDPYVHVNFFESRHIGP